MNKQKLEVSKIQAILKGTQCEPQQSDNALNYSFDEKCTAIFNWAKTTEAKFNVEMVEGIHANVMHYGRPTQNQMRTINNIITRFNINVSTWAF